MQEVVLKPIMKTYKDRGMSEDDIRTDMVLAIQNRIMGLSQKERDELGLKNDFIDSHNLFDMIDKKQIRFKYNKKSADNKPTYNIVIDVDGDGLFMDLPNPFDPNDSYSPEKLELPRAYEITPKKIKEMAYQEEWKQGFEERDQQYENIGLGGVKRELEYLRYQTFKLFDNFIVNNGKKVAEKAAGLIPFVDYNYDDWEEQSQKVLRREAALNQIYKLTGDEYETRLYSGLVKQFGVSGDAIMKQENILFRYISDNEGGYKANAYETKKGNGDWTIGHGLSLKDDTVLEELKRLRYNVDDLMNGKTSIKFQDSAWISHKIIENKYQEVKAEALKYGVDLTGNKNSYLTMAIVDMAYQGLTGPRFFEALGKYIETGDAKYLGTFDSYNGDGEAIRKWTDKEKGILNPDYENRESTVLGELWNDGKVYKDIGMGGVFVRNEDRANKILSWDNGQYTNFVNMKFDESIAQRPPEAITVE